MCLLIEQVQSAGQCTCNDWKSGWPSCEELTAYIEHSQWTKHCPKHSTLIFSSNPEKSCYSLHSRDHGAGAWRVKPLSQDHIARMLALCCLGTFVSRQGDRIQETSTGFGRGTLWERGTREQRGLKSNPADIMVSRKKLSSRRLHAAGMLFIELQRANLTKYVWLLTCRGLE